MNYSNQRSKYADLHSCDYCIGEWRKLLKFEIKHFFEGNRVTPYPKVRIVDYP